MSNLSDLAAQIERARVRRELKAKLIHVYTVIDNKRTTVPHVLVPGVGLVPLTPDQIAELGES